MTLLWHLAWAFRLSSRNFTSHNLNDISVYSQYIGVHTTTKNDLQQHLEFFLEADQNIIRSYK